MTMRKKQNSISSIAPRKPNAKPWVTVKFAQTLDGRLATKTGDSKWISSEGALEFAHRLRSKHDAILVGVGTVLADDPRLNVRLVKGRDPLRVVVDSRLRTPLHSKLLDNSTDQKTIIATTKLASAARARKVESLGAELVKLPLDKRGRVNLERLLDALWRRGVKSVLVEGGAEIITSLLKANLVDRFVVVIAPKLIGQGKESIGQLGITRLRDAIEFSSVKVRRLGPDLIVDGIIGRPSR